MKSKNYLHLGSLVIEIRRRSINGQYVKTEDIILENCPVSVFRYKRSIFYRLDQEEQLRKYLRSRLKELGLI